MLNKEALQSNVSEEVKEEISNIMNDLMEEEIGFVINAKYYKRMHKLYHSIAKLQFRLEDLKQSISNRLNEEYDDGNKDYYKHIYYDKEYQLFMIEGVVSLFQVSIDRLINKQ